MKRILFALSILILTLSPNSALAINSWGISTFHSDIAIEESGTVLITETIRTQFNSEKHGIYRDIPVTYEDRETHEKTYTKIEVQSVEQDDETAKYTLESNRANLRIKIGDADRTITGQHSYQITYRATGILRGYTDYDELYWNVTGSEWETSIEKATASVTLPSGEIKQLACYNGTVGETATCDKTTVGTQRAEFGSTSAIDPGQDLTIAVGYTKGVIPLLTVPAPVNPFGVPFFLQLVSGFLVISALGIFFAVRYWWKHGRDAQSAADTTKQDYPVKADIAPEYESPMKLRPAEIGVLMDERADTLDVIATLVDLASRGYLTITEIPKKWVFGTTDYQFDQVNNRYEKLLGYEKRLMSALFEDGTTVKMSELRNSFYKDLTEIKDEIYQECHNKGLFANNPDKIRKNALAIGLLLAVGGIVIAVNATGWIVSSATTGTPIPFLLGVCYGLAVAGIAVLIMSFTFPAKTAYGREMYRLAKGYELFINTAEKYRARFAEKENLYTEILPYAIVFGATKKLANAMKDMGINPPAPTWYIGAHHFNPVLFSSSIDSMSSSLSSAMASTPGGSGSGGGGSSGGGFGGGGGGSW